MKQLKPGDLVRFTEAWRTGTVWKPDKEESLRFRVLECGCSLCRSEEYVHITCINPNHPLEYQKVPRHIHEFHVERSE